MVSETIKNTKSAGAELRRFGITVGIVLGLWGGLFLWRGRDCFSYFFILSAAFLLLGLVVPVVLKPIHKVWMTLAMLLGLLMTRVVLSLLFYLVVTPIGLLARLFGKDFLNLNFNKNADSFWISKGAVKFKRDSCEKQF
jgi:hypothetical protein